MPCFITLIQTLKWTRSRTHGVLCIVDILEAFVFIFMMVRRLKRKLKICKVQYFYLEVFI